MLNEDKKERAVTAEPFAFGQFRRDQSDLKHEVAYQSLQNLQASSNEDEAIEHATQIISVFLKADCYGVMLVDPARAALHCHPSARSGCGHVDMLPLVAKSIVTKVFNAGCSIRLSNARLDLNYYPIDREIRSELCVPLEINGQRFGVINVESKERDGFTLDDERTLTNIAAHLAAKLDRLRAQPTSSPN
jgi:GAF domain-containing protein